MSIAPSQQTDTSSAPQPASSKPKHAPLYHVVLLDDDDHTYEYVIEMLGRLFRLAPQSAFKLAAEVDQSGRVIVDTTWLERAELKREQIHTFGPDRRIPRCKGGMSAVLEPVPQSE